MKPHLALLLGAVAIGLPAHAADSACAPVLKAVRAGMAQARIHAAIDLPLDPVALKMGLKPTLMHSIVIDKLQYSNAIRPGFGKTALDSPEMLALASDLASGRSTFMVEMTEAAAILNGATEKSLVLMDEIGRGTSTFDGVALAFAIARHLLEKNRAWTLFSTHYFELTRLAQDSPICANIHLDAVEHGHKIVFLHAVEEGPASQSYGVQVAALAGMPPAVVREARRRLALLENREAGTLQQPDLFASAPPLPEPPHPALDALRDLNPDELSPREALDRLYQLNRMARQ